MLTEREMLQRGGDLENLFHAGPDRASADQDDDIALLDAFRAITLDCIDNGFFSLEDTGGPARVFQTEKAVINAIKSNGPERIKEGDVIVLICRGPIGSGMEEIFQITSALKHLSFGKHVAVLTTSPLAASPPEPASATSRLKLWLAVPSARFWKAT